MSARAVIQRATERTASVTYRQTDADPTVVVRGPMPLPQAISLAGWLNGAEWLTTDQMKNVPHTWTAYQEALAT